MAQDLCALIEESRFEIVQRLQVDRSSLFDYLRSKRVFDAHDCEDILSAKTREQRASKFLDVLQTKGQDGLSCFLDILQVINPGLYTVITGKKANPCHLWENMNERFTIGTQVADVELLSGQLKRTIDDLQDLALRNQQLLKENHNLGKKLDQASTDLDLKHRRVEALERQKSDSTKGVLEAHTNANRLSECMAQQLRVLQQGLFERNTYIIALQMKLLATEEEIKETKRSKDELMSKNELLSAKWQELSKNYDQERRESMKLNAKLQQIGNLQKPGEFERKYIEFKQINQKMMLERGESLCDLEDLKDMSEALKLRYDLIEQENQQLQQNFISTASENSKLQEVIEGMKMQLSLSNVRVSDLKGWNVDLEETAKQYREQRDYFSQARNTALKELEENYKEVEAVTSKFKEKIADRETMIKKQTEHAKKFEEKYEKACSDMKLLQARIATVEKQLEDIRLKRVNATSCATQTSDFDIPKRPGSTSDNEPVDEVEAYPWKQRRDVKEIMLSLRKRVTGKRQEAMSLDRSLDMLDMEGSLSREAKKCLGHQRGQLLFKSPPTYTLLRAMFGQTVGGHACSFDVDEGNLENNALAAFEKSIEAEQALDDSDDEYTNDTKKTYSSAVGDFSIEQHEDIEREKSVCSWDDNESSDIKDDDVSKGKSRLGFRQRACVIKRKGQRSASEPVVMYPGASREKAGDDL